METDTRGFAVPGIRGGSQAATAIELGMLLQVARLAGDRDDAGCTELGLEPVFVERARRVERGTGPLPCEGERPDFAAVSELMARLLVGPPSPLAGDLLMVVVRRATELQGVAGPDPGVPALRRAATTPALERVRSLLVEQGLPQRQRQDSQRGARDRLRPLVARALLERDTELGRSLCARLPDDLLLTLVGLEDGDRALVRDELLDAAAKGHSTARLRRRARRLIAAVERVAAPGGEEEAAVIAQRRQACSREQRQLEVVGALMSQAQELADALGLGARVVLVPRGLFGHVPVGERAPIGNARVRSGALTPDPALRWLGRLGEGLRGLCERVPDWLACRVLAWQPP
jgi:hypothetical protein